MVCARFPAMLGWPNSCSHRHSVPGRLKDTSSYKPLRVPIKTAPLLVTYDVYVAQENIIETVNELDMSI